MSQASILTVIDLYLDSLQEQATTASNMDHARYVAGLAHGAITVARMAGVIPTKASFFLHDLAQDWLRYGIRQ